MTKPQHRGHPIYWAILVMVFAGFLVSLSVQAQVTGFNEREVKTDPGDADKSGVWTLDFRFKDPRILKVHVPGRGTRICWYMWYQVINRTNTPHKFIPEFELVTLDTPGRFSDELLLTVQENVKKLEDPTGYQGIKNSVTIASESIPVSKEGNSFPRAITGVAIWDASQLFDSAPGNKAKQLNETKKFRIFITGLSNGWVLVDPIPAGPNALPVVRRKTLQLSFLREGGRFGTSSQQIRFDGSPRWVYRASPLVIPQSPDDAKALQNPNKKDVRIRLPGTLRLPQLDFVSTQMRKKNGS